MNFGDLIRMSPFYKAMVEQMPEEERALAESQLASILGSYETIVSALPGEAMTELSKAMAHDDPTQSIDNSGVAPTKRAPRRF